MISQANAYYLFSKKLISALALCSLDPIFPNIYISLPLDLPYLLGSILEDQRTPFLTQIQLFEYTLKANNFQVQQSENRKCEEFVGEE